MPTWWDEVNDMGTVTERREDEHLLPDQGYPQVIETWMGEGGATTVTFVASGYHLWQVYYSNNLNNQPHQHGL